MPVKYTPTNVSELAFVVFERPEGGVHFEKH